MSGRRHPPRTEVSIMARQQSKRGRSRWLVVAGVGSAALLLSGAALTLRSPIDGIALESLGLAGSGQAQEIEPDYGLIERQLFESQPDDWGGTFIDDGYLFVNYVGISLDEAAQRLVDIGVHSGVKLRAVEVSLADLDRAMSEFERTAPANVTSYGPDYRTGQLVVSYGEQIS